MECWTDIYKVIATVAMFSAFYYMGRPLWVQTLAVIVSS